MIKECTLILPWPPSVNAIWSTTGKGNWYSTKVARDFKELVKYVVYTARSPKFGKNLLMVELLAYPPDGRRRDLDNLAKVSFDALEDAGVFDNDCQIKRIYMEMKEKDPEGKGKVIVKLAVIE